jgi:hypothetical protein
VLLAGIGNGHGATGRAMGAVRTVKGGRFMRFAGDGAKYKIRKQLNNNRKR